MGIWDFISTVISLNNSVNGNIGSLGDVIFEVSAYTKVRTLSDYKRSYKARLAEHEIINRKPIVEFLGPGLQSISFNMQFNAFCGVNPTKEMARIKEYCENGEVLRFILGNEPVGDNKWIIESADEVVKHFNADGKVIYSEVSISLKEYVVNEVENT